MARITYSPLVSEMSGKVGDAVFSRWKGIAYLRTRVTPANPNSTAQQTQRNALSNTLDLWQSVKAALNTYWETAAEGYAMSGYNRFMATNIPDVRDSNPTELTPYDEDMELISSEGIAAGGAGEIDCTWTQGDATDADDQVAVYYRKTESGSEVFSWTHDADATPSSGSHTITGLDTGQEYEVALFCERKDASAAQQSYVERLNAG